MGLSYRDAIAVAEIVFYVPAFAIAVFLVTRHGIDRKSGWFFMVIFTLARLLGSILQLASLSAPTNTQLFEAIAILSNVGLSPLMLAALGLVSRVRFSVLQTGHSSIPMPLLWLVEIMTIVALILSIVGVTSLPDTIFEGIQPAHKPSTMTASSILFIVAFVGLVLFVLFLWIQLSHVAQGERRVLIAVSASIPFLIVRVAYSALVSLGHNKNFSLVRGNTTDYLVMELIMEAIIVIMYEGMGVTLQRLSSDERAGMKATRQGPRNAPAAGPGRQGDLEMGNNKVGGGFGGRAGGQLASLGRKTLIGRLITSFQD